VPHKSLFIGNRDRRPIFPDRRFSVEDTHGSPTLKTTRRYLRGIRQQSPVAEKAENFTNQHIVFVTSFSCVF